MFGFRFATVISEDEYLLWGGSYFIENLHFYEIFFLFLAVPVSEVRYFFGLRLGQLESNFTTGRHCRRPNLPITFGYLLSD